jgi:hypothetical protein
MGVSYVCVGVKTSEINKFTYLHQTKYVSVVSPTGHDFRCFENNQLDKKELHAFIQ